MRLTIGVDPGSTGAVVALLDGREPLAWLRMPTVQARASSGRRVNGAALAAWLRAYPDAHAYIEAVHAMPGQGVSSTFAFGHAAGTAEGVLQALAIPYTLVSPVTWKRRAGITGKGKDGSRARAAQLWPGWRQLDAKEAGQAFADAALIALYGGQA